MPAHKSSDVWGGSKEPKDRKGAKNSCGGNEQGSSSIVACEERLMLRLHARPSTSSLCFAFLEGQKCKKRCNYSVGYCNAVFCTSYFLDLVVSLRPSTTMALRPQLSFCHGINDRESMIKRTLTKIKTNRQGEGEIMVDAEEIQVKSLGWVYRKKLVVKALINLLLSRVKVLKCSRLTMMSFSLWVKKVRSLSKFPKVLLFTQRNF